MFVYVLILECSKVSEDCQNMYVHGDWFESLEHPHYVCKTTVTWTTVINQECQFVSLFSLKS